MKYAAVSLEHDYLVEVWKVDVVKDCQPRDQPLVRDNLKRRCTDIAEIRFIPRIKDQSKRRINMKKLIIIAIAILILVAAFQVTKNVSAAMIAPPAQALQEDDTMLISKTGANLELQDIVIRKFEAGPEINFRVRVKNTGAVSAGNLNDNLVVILRVKNAQTGAWDELQQWSNIDSIKAGETVARDRTPVKSENADVLSNQFTLQAEIMLKSPGKVTISRNIIEGTYPVDSVTNP